MCKWIVALIWLSWGPIYKKNCYSNKNSFLTSRIYFNFYKCTYICKKKIVLNLNTSLRFVYIFNIKHLYSSFPFKDKNMCVLLHILKFKNVPIFQVKLKNEGTPNKSMSFIANFGFKNMSFPAIGTWLSASLLLNSNLIL